MNRADRRRQEKRAKGGAWPSPAPGVRPLLQEAMALQQSGQLTKAGQLYEQILVIDPDCGDALHLLGLVAYQSGAFDRATELITRAIHGDPSNAAYSFNLGLALQKRGRLDEAVTAYEQAIRLRPQYHEALSNLGHVRLEQGRFGAAEQAYRTALSFAPTSPEGHNNLGVALKEQGRLRDAETSYRQALHLNPHHAEAYCNLGAVLMEQGRYDEAATEFDQALRLKPQYVNALYHQGFAWLWRGDRDRAIACFRRTAEIKQNHRRPVGDVVLSRSRLKHDAEQMHYLLARGILSVEWQPFAASLDILRSHPAFAAEGADRMRVTGLDAVSVAPSFNQIIHWGLGEALDGGALNPALDVASIETDYERHAPGITAIDHLLTPEALGRFRQFCLEATIWKREYENGYLGAFLGDGLACPVLLQLADELRERFPAIFKQHRLTQVWAFKQDSVRKGLNLHADAAAVNVNFWITPDEANLDPEHGGLIVWDKEAPADWNFKDYNSSRHEPKVREFLRASGAQPVTVPYRANRAVVFNSDLFHETDRLHFRDDYESRRINVTLLYGRRHE